MVLTFQNPLNNLGVSNTSNKMATIPKKDGRFVKGQIPWIAGKKHSEITRQKISMSNTGKSHTEEQKQKIKLSNMGKHSKAPRSKETKMKMSLALRGKPSAMKGKKHTKEAKLKMSLNSARKGKPSVMKGKHHTAESKRIMSIKSTGRIISEETRQKMSGKIPWNKDKKGVQPCSEATRIKMRLHSPFKGKKLGPRSEETKARIRLARAKQITPLKDTTIEVKMQDFLKQLKIEFFTHQWMDIEHGYQCDILIPSARTVIECYGNYWHNYPYGREKDIARCTELRAKGYRVLIFWESEIKAMQLSDLSSKLNYAHKTDSSSIFEPSLRAPEKALENGIILKGGQNE